MPGSEPSADLSLRDAGSAALEWALGLLSAPVGEGLPSILAGLAGAFRATAAGLARPGEPTTTPVVRVRADGQPLPPALAWPEEPELRARLRDTVTAVVFEDQGNGTVLATRLDVP